MGIDNPKSYRHDIYQSRCNRIAVTLIAVNLWMMFWAMHPDWTILEFLKHSGIVIFVAVVIAAFTIGGLYIVLNLLNSFVDWLMVD